MTLTRREALAAAGGLCVAPLSGCTGLLPSRPRLTLTLLNFDAEEHTVHVDVLRADADERDLVLRGRYHLPTMSEDGDGHARREEDVLESRRYLVRAYLRDYPAVRGTFQFYPDCTGEDEPPEELYVEVRREPDRPRRYIEFRRNVCSSDSWWY